MKKLHILHLEDSPTDVELIQLTLATEGFRFDVVRVETRADFLAALEHDKFDIILCDYTLPRFNGISALALAQERCPDVPFIFVAGTIDEEVAIELLRNGATDYVLKDKLARLAPAMRRALHEAEERSQRQQAVEALRESEERFRAFMDHTPAVVFIKDMDGRLVFANKTWETVFHQNEADILGKTDFELWSPEIAQQLREHDVAVLTTQQPLKVTEKVPTPDGKLREWFVVKFPITIGSTKAFVGGVAVDITERLRAEEKIHEQAALLDKAHDAIGVIDLEYRILYWNKGAEHLYGWTAEEAMGKKAEELLYIPESPEHHEIQKNVSEKGEWTGELRQRTKDGRAIIVQSRWTLVRDHEGNPKSILIINTDITEKKKLETQFFRAQRMESIGKLAGGIAHDLNNVFQPIMMAVQMLQRKLPDAQSQRMLTTLETSARRGADLVKQVMSFAAGVEGERTIVQVRHLISEFQKIARETFPKSIEIHVNAPRTLWTVSGDATQLHQVLMNLCVNARDAMPSGGTLTITADNLMLDEHYARMNIDAKVGPYIIITISDTGVGIPHEIIERIFEPFFTTKEADKGTGLGLSTVFTIVKSHGGFIHVYSEVGKGTTFKVYLPALPATQIQNAEQQQLDLPMGKEELILVVDDEAPVCEMFKGALEAYNYRVLLASHGAEAVALYIRYKYEIKAVFLDMMMPIMDGPATLHALRTINPMVKIIATSGRMEKGVELQARNAQAFLLKPFTGEILIKTLHEVLGRQG
jgi:PAS domain S-box-containing protein